MLDHKELVRNKFNQWVGFPFTISLTSLKVLQDHSFYSYLYLHMIRQNLTDFH